MELLLISILLCLFTTIAILLRFISTQTSANLPPGPSRLPIIGNLHNLGDQPHKSLADLAQIHGPLMSLKLGQVIATVVASSSHIAKEILQKHDQVLSDCQVILAVQAHDHHKFGMSMLPVGSTWRNLRKVCNMYLFTTQKLDSKWDLRGKEMEKLMQGVRQNACEGKAMDIGRVGFMTNFSALSRTVLSLEVEEAIGDMMTLDLPRSSLHS